MARTVKPEEFATKRKDILDAAQRLVFTKGYEQMAVRDILEELQISSGAFHHYFGSRAELLDAMTERMQSEVEGPLLPIIHDPNLTAVQKFQGFFDTLDRLRQVKRSFITKLMHVWYTDDNAIIRQKVDEAVVKQRAPLLSEIVRQGVREGVFNTPYPDQAGEVILALLKGMSDTHAKLFLSVDEAPDKQAVIDRIVTIHAAYMDAVERVLGAAPQALYRAKPDEVKGWLTAEDE